MQPQYVATFSEKPAVLEGHPFVVEAGVSLGGAEVRAVAGMTCCAWSETYVYAPLRMSGVNAAGVMSVGYITLRVCVDDDGQIVLATPVVGEVLDRALC